MFAISSLCENSLFGSNSGFAGKLSIHHFSQGQVTPRPRPTFLTKAVLDFHINQFIHLQAFSPHDPSTEAKLQILDVLK
ncbi:hypothetical protein KIL84_005111, partial [Mauremys mutica]